MREARIGDTVRVKYRARADGDGGPPRSPEEGTLEFTLGEDQVIPGFEQVVLGMRPNETRKKRVPPGLAYGDHRPGLEMPVDKHLIPKDIPLEEGQALAVPGRENPQMLLTVKEVTPKTVLLDANHPLAGLHLDFEITLLEIKQGP